MNGRAHRAAVTVVAFVAVFLIVFTPTMFIIGQNRWNDRVDEITETQQREINAGRTRDAIQTTHAAQLEDVIAEQAEIIADLAAVQAAFELAACRYGNEAKRIAREDADVAVSVVLAGLRASPHSSGLVDQIEADIRSRMSTAEKVDHDCSMNGVIDAGDYPP